HRGRERGLKTSWAVSSPASPWSPPESGCQTNPGHKAAEPGARGILAHFAAASQINPRGEIVASCACGSSGNPACGGGVGGRGGANTVGESVGGVRDACAFEPLPLPLAVVIAV